MNRTDAEIGEAVIATSEAATPIVRARCGRTSFSLPTSTITGIVAKDA